MDKHELGRTFEDGEIIFRQGDLGDCMYVIQDGKVEVILNQNGSESTLAVRGQGEFFGEMALFEDEVRMASVRAVGRVRLLSVDKKNLLRHIHQDPSLAYRMIQIMSQRIREMSRDTARAN